MFGRSSFSTAAAVLVSKVAKASEIDFRDRNKRLMLFVGFRWGRDVFLWGFLMYDETTCHCPKQDGNGGAQA